MLLASTYFLKQRRLSIQYIPSILNVYLYWNLLLKSVKTKTSWRRQFLSWTWKVYVQLCLSESRKVQTGRAYKAKESRRAQAHMFLPIHRRYGWGWCTDSVLRSRTCFISMWRINWDWWWGEEMEEVQCLTLERKRNRRIQRQIETERHRDREWTWTRGAVICFLPAHPDDSGSLCSAQRWTTAKQRHNNAALTFSASSNSSRYNIVSP